MSGKQRATCTGVEGPRGERVEQVGKGFVARLWYSAGHSVSAPRLRDEAIRYKYPGGGLQASGAKVPKAERLGRRVKV